jgi:hypothetical protein
MHLSKGQFIDPTFKLGVLRVDIVVGANFGPNLVNINTSTSWEVRQVDP